MKNIIWFLFLILLMSIAWLFSHRETLQAPFLATQQSVVQYRIGQIDPRFNISEKELHFLAYEATQIWEKSLNQTLFEYHPEATLQINLVYDERQQRSEYIDEINKVLDDKDAELEKMRQRLDDQLKSLEQRKKTLEQQYHQLNNERSQWSLSEFNSGENMQRLNKQIDALNQRRYKLSDEYDVYHLNVKLYNQKIKEFNQYAEKGKNYTLQNPSRMFHKGTYDGHDINIYHMRSKNDLKMVLAHEFGHALGLDHHQEPKALMYSLVAEQDIDNFSLHPADMHLFQQQSKFAKK